MVLCSLVIAVVVHLFMLLAQRCFRWILGIVLSCGGDWRFGRISVWVDGVAVSDLTYAGVDNNNYGVVTRLDVGCIYSSSSTVDIYVDSAIVSRNYIGP